MTTHSFSAVAAAFLLAFPALFSIVNPIGGALTFGRVTAEHTHDDRIRLAGRIGTYAFLMLVGSLWLGSYVLNFLGISLGALRIAGGLVVASRAWELLTAPEQRSARKDEQAASAEAQPIDEIAFFPLTMPFTTGPGTISVAIALGSERPAEKAALILFFIGVTIAAAMVSATVWIAYSTSDRVTSVLGQNGTRITTRLAAFLLLCVGVQILCNGVLQLLQPLFRHI